MNFQLKSFVLNQIDKISLKLILALFIALLTPILFFLIYKSEPNLNLVTAPIIILFFLGNTFFVYEEYDAVKDIVGNNLTQLLRNKHKSVFWLFLGSLTLCVFFGMIILATILARTMSDTYDFADFYPIVIIVIIIGFERKYIRDTQEEVRAANNS